MNKVSITKWETLLPPSDPEKVEVLGIDGVEMSIKHTLSLKEMMQFVEDVVSSCVDTATGTFSPEVRGFAIKSALVSTYANFNTPTDTSKLYDLLYRTNIVEQILPRINMEQFNEMLFAIDKRIEHATRVIESQTAFEVSSIVERISVLTAQFEAAFDGIDINKVNQTMENIRTISGMSEERIARAVIDMHNESRVDTGSNGNIVVLPNEKE